MSRAALRVVALCALAVACPPRHAAAGLPFDVQGHRGSLGTVPPGNTIPSYQEAIAVGATTLEGDMRLTFDGRPIMLHDAAIPIDCAWTGGGSPPTRTLALLTAAQVALFDCHPAIAGMQPPPPVEALLDLHVGNDIRFNLEFKVNGAANVDLFLGAIVDYNTACSGCLQDRLIFQSFQHADCEYVRAAYYDLPASGNLRFRNSLLGSTTLQDLAGKLAYADIYSPPWTELDASRVAAVHALGLDVLPYTVDAENAMRALIAMGVDGIITNYPARLVAVLAEQPPSAGAISGSMVNLLQNPGAEQQPVTGAGWIAAAGDWTIARGDDAGGIGTHSGQRFFWGGQSASAELYQEVDLASYRGWLGDGARSALFVGYLGSWTGDADSAQVVIEARDGLGTVLDSTSSPAASPDAWTRVELRFPLPPTTATVRVRLLAQRLAGADNNGYFDDVGLFLPAPNLLVNPGAEQQPVTSHGWTAAAGNWTLARGDDAGGIGTHAGANFFWGGQSATAELYQEVDLGALRGYLGAAERRIRFIGYLGSWSGDGDAADVVLEARDAAGNVLAQSGSAPASPDQWTRREVELGLPIDTASVRVRLLATRLQGSDNNAYFDSVGLYLPVVNLVANPGAETQPVTAVGWTEALGDWTIARGDDAGGSGTHSGDNFHWGGQWALAELYQDIDLAPYRGWIGDGARVADLIAWLGSWSGDADSSQVVIEWLDEAGQSISSSTIGPVDATSWLMASRPREPIPALAATARLRLIAQRQSGSDNNAYFDDLHFHLDFGDPDAIFAEGFEGGDLAGRPQGR